MAPLDDPFEPQDTIPGSQPRAPGTLDEPLPQVAEVPRDLARVQPAAVSPKPPEPPETLPVQTGPDGQPLPPGTAWGYSPGGGPGGPYSRRVTEGPAPAWMTPNERSQVLAFRRERVAQPPPPEFTPPREQRQDPNSAMPPSGVTPTPTRDPMTLAQEYEQDLSPRVASSRNVGYLHSLFNAVMDPFLRSAGGDIPRGLQVITGQQGGILGDAADAVDNWVADNLQVNPAYRDDIFVGMIAPIIGNFAGIASTFFLTAGVGAATAGAARATGLIGQAAAGAGAVSARTGIMGAVLGRNATQTAGRVGSFGLSSFPQNAAEQYRDAMQNGANWDDIIAASRYNGVLSGALDVLPVFHGLSVVDHSMGNVIQRGLLRTISENKYRIMETGFSEMATEMMQQVTSNLIASGLVAYDPNRDWYEGTAASGIGGFGGGALMQAMINLLPGGRRVHNPNNLPPPGSGAMGRPGGPGGPGGQGGGPALIGGPGFPGGPGGTGGGPTDFGPAPTGIEGHEDMYFALPPRENRTEFLRAQQQRIRELDAAWKQDRPDYVGDPVVGSSLEFYNYLVRSEADFERLRNLPPERAAQPDVQARMREMEANREVIDLMMDPVRMVNRPVWILQRPGRGKGVGEAIQLATDESGQPIRRDGRRERVVGIDGKDYLVGSAQVMQIDNVAPENVVLSPQGQNILRLARLRMSGEQAAREAQANAEQQAAADAASGQARGQRDPRAAAGPQAQRALPAPPGQRALPSPQGRTYGPGFTMFDDTAPATPEAAQAAHAAAAERLAQPQAEMFSSSDTNSVKPETGRTGVAHEPLKPPPLTEQEQLELGGLTQTSGQQAQARTRATETGAAAMATLVPKRVALEDLPGEIRQKMDMAAIRSGIKLPETFNQQDLVEAGMAPAEAADFFLSIDRAANYSAMGRAAAHDENATPPKRGIAGIMEFFADLPRRERRAIRKMLQHFERHIGPALSDLDIIDFANWAAAADMTLAKQGRAARNFSDPVNAAAYMHSSTRALGDGIRRAAIALRAENATDASKAKAIKRLAHELTHFMIGLTGQNDADMAALWDKLNLNMQNDPTFQEVVREYGADFPPAVLAHEFLAHKMQAAMAGRYETSFAKLKPGEDPSLRTYIAEFIRRALQFVSDAYDWMLGRDIINTVFGDIAQKLQVNLDTYTLVKTEIEPGTGEVYFATDDEAIAKKLSGDAGVAATRDAALSYYVVLHKGNRKSVDKAMRSELGDTWKNLSAELRSNSIDAAITRTEGYTDLSFAYQKNLLIGAPSNPRKFSELFRLAYKGEGKDGNGKLWYEHTADQFLARFNENARTFLQYLSVTSPQNRVGPNTGQGINAYAQALMRPHAKIGAYPELGISVVGTPSVTKMANDLKETGTWSDTAEKTQSFYRALAEDLDLSGEDYTGVVDRWMMRAFGFNTDNPTPGQYIHARLIMRAMADALGWKVKWLQAAVWCGIKLESDNPRDWDVRNYGDFLKLKQAGVNFEVRPSDNFATGAMFTSLSRDDQLQITATMITQLFPEIVSTLNIEPFNPLFNVVHGGFLGKQSPSVETRVPLPDWAIDTMSAAIGYVFRQDSVLVTRVEGYGAYIKNPTSFLAATFGGQEDIDPDAAKRLWDHIISVDPNLHGGYSVQGNKMLFFNLKDDVSGALSKQPLSKLTDDEFSAALEAALVTYPTNLDIKLSTPGIAEARLISNDWKANPDGEGYATALERIRPGLTGKLYASRARGDEILASEFAKRNLSLPPAGPVNTVGRPIAAPVPVGGPVDVRDGSPREPATQDELAGVANPEVQLAGVDPGAFAEKQIYERYGITQPGIDTTETLKVYPLDLLVSEPERVNQMLLDHQAVMKEFAYQAEDGVEEVLPRLGVDGYHKGTIWIYNPKVQNASFRDEHYTRAWRASHELAHGITEALMQKKYGRSRRYARLGRSMMGERGKGEKTILVELDPLTLREAQRAVEWEHNAFRVQRKLLEAMGVQITDDQFAQEYNINMSDAVYRTVTGQFGNPGQLGFVPATDQKSIEETLWLLEQFENEIAREQRRDPTVGINLTAWKDTTDEELDNLIAQSRETGLASVAVQPKDDFPGEEFTDSDPGMAQELYSGQAYPNLRAAIYNSTLEAGDSSAWRAEFRKAKVPLDELRWSGMLDWLKKRTGGKPITRGMIRNFINAAEVMIDGSEPGKLHLRSNPSDTERTDVTLSYEPRQDSQGRLFFHITEAITTGGRERTLLMLRRATRWAIESGFHGVSWAGDLIQRRDPNWKKDGDYIARDVPTGVNFRARLVPKTGTAFISMIYIPPSQRGVGTGAAIVDQFERTAAEQGMRRVEGKALPNSVPFWERRGYIVAPEQDEDGMHPMTKFIGSRDPSLPMREQPLTPEQAAQAIAKDFDAKIETVKIAQPSAKQLASPTPPGAMEKYAPDYQPGRALIANDPMVQSVNDDIGEIYFSRVRTNVPPAFQPSPVSPNWPKFWQKHGRFLRSLDLLVAQSSKRVRSLMGQTPAAFEMGNHLRRDPWQYVAPNLKGQIAEDYHGVVQGMLGQLMPPLARKFSEIAATYPKATRALALTEIAVALRGGNVNPATGNVQLAHIKPADARWFRQWLDTVIDFTNRHMQGNTIWGAGGGTPHVAQKDLVKRLPNYFPQLWKLDGKFGDGPFSGVSKTAVVHAFFKGLGFHPGATQDEDIADLINTVLGDGGFVSYAATNRWRSGTVVKLTPRIRDRLLKIDPNISIPVTVGGVTADVTLNDFLDNNPLTIMPHYAIGMARQGEFNRRFGPRGEEIDRLMELNDAQRAAAGMSPLVGDDLNKVIYQIHGNFHAHQNRLGKTATEATALFKFLANANMLFFTALMSIPEIMMGGVRLGMRGSYYGLLGGLKQVGYTISRQGDSDAKRIAKDLGVIRDNFQQSILDYATDHASLTIFGKTADQWTNTLFLRTAVDAWTNFGRTMAIAGGIRALPHWADKAAQGSQRHQRWLLEVGLIPADLAGFDPDTYIVGQNVKIDGALRQIAGEVIVTGTPGSSPGWMSDPRFRLVAHIKSFMINFGNTVLQRPMRELAYYNPMPVIWLTAYAALAALHASIWEGITYGPQGNPAWRRAGLVDHPKTQFALNMASRGGLAMPLQLFVDAVAMNRTAQGGSLIGGLVPAAAVADRLWNFGSGLVRLMGSGFDNPQALHQIVNNATLLIPGISQSGGFRQWMVDAMAPSPGQPPSPLPWTSHPPQARGTPHGAAPGGMPYGGGRGGNVPYGGGRGGNVPYGGTR